MYLVDTNVLSEARRRSPQALAWTRSVDEATVFVSVITLGEISAGILAKQRHDPASAAKIAEWLRWLRGRHAGRILPVSEDVAMEWGRISALRTRGVADALIAATAIVHDLVVVTRNIKDFHDMGAAILDPWSA